MIWKKKNVMRVATVVKVLSDNKHDLSAIPENT